MTDFRNPQTKLHAARARLILERPFIGTLVMHLALAPVDAAWCATIATDARTLYFNPRYIGALDFQETQFALAHAALHCALGHFARRSHRERLRWDIATDYAVNLLLVDDGMRRAPGALLNPGFRGLAAEEIYPLIPARPGLDTLDRHLFDAAADAFGSHEAREELARVWQSRLVAAGQQARRAGRLGESWLRAIDELVEPNLPWRSLLARFMLGVARDDYSFQRLSRRGGDALLPGLKSGEVEVCVALDTSGSIADGELRQFTSEIDALKGQVRAHVTVHACDEALDHAGPWSFQAWEPIELPGKLHGGGGTSFVPVFDWLEREHARPDLLVYFTDAEGEFPAMQPDYPVVWLVKGRAPVPWGERIQLN